MSPQIDMDEGADKVHLAIRGLAASSAMFRHDDSRQQAKDLRDGLDLIASSMLKTAKITQVEQFKEEVKILRTSTEAAMSSLVDSGISELDRAISEIRQATVNASAAIKKEEHRAAAALSLAKQDCDQHVALAKRAVVDATRAIQDERLKAVDAIALHTANATRQSPTLPDIVQALSSLHASTTSHGPNSPSSSNDNSIIENLTSRLSALEASANQKQANIDKLVHDALAKQNQQHQQMLDSLVQTKIDKALSKQNQKPAHVLDSMIQTKIDKTLAKLDKRFEKELAGVRGELAAALAREKALSEIRVKEQEKYQQALKAVSDKLINIPSLLSLVEKKVDEYLASKEEKEEGETSVILDDEVRALIDKAVDDKMATAKHNKEHEHDLKAVRHDILDLAHSFLEVKSAIQASPRTQDGVTTQSVSKMDDKLALLTNVTDLKQTTFGSSIPTAIPKMAPTTITTDTITASPPVPTSASDEGDDYAVTDGSDDEASTVPEISDDGYCVMEPSRAELSVNTPAANNEASGLDEPPSPTSTSTTFDNNGPLHLIPAHSAALLQGALLLSTRDGYKLLNEGVPDSDEPSDSFVELHRNYSDHISEPMDVRSLWLAYRALLNSKNENLNTDPTGSGGSGPVMWEGGGLNVPQLDHPTLVESRKKKQSRKR